MKESDHLQKRTRVSVALCAHNPRKDFLAAALESLRRQTLDHAEWELIVVDNGSNNDVLPAIDLSWHPLARMVTESELGLTHARLKAIREAKGDVVVFVDDDNVLDPGYLENAIRIAGKHPYIGVWGGAIVGRFEAPVAASVLHFQELLAIRSCDEPVWGHMYGLSEITPYGAGICVRMEILQVYKAGAEKNTGSTKLGRKGDLLAGGEDVDIGYTALDLGFATGRFPDLKLEHLIPQSRTTRSYLCRLAFGSALSAMVLAALRPATSGAVRPPSVFGLLINLVKNRRWGLTGLSICHAAWRGARRGAAEVLGKP